MEEKLEIISGTVKHVVYSNSETGFAVIELQNKGETETAIGMLAELKAGEEVELTGRFTVHTVYGQQFKAEVFVKTLPTGSAAIMRYLSSGAVKGIGPATAKKIVSIFGDRTFEVMENSPEELTRIRGISLSKAKEIQSTVAGKRSIRELCLRLGKYGLSPDESLSAFKVLGDSTVELIEENPYLLCKAGIDIGFERADEIAEMLKKPADCEDRLCAGIAYVISHNRVNGHTCLPKAKVVEIALKLLETDALKIEDAIYLMVDRGEIKSIKIDGADQLAETDTFLAEEYIANRLITELSFAQGEKPVSESEIKSAEKELGIRFEGLQRNAVAECASAGVFILTGGPGTGKTTTVNGMIKVLEKRGMKVALAAPTGRAAKRMTELTGKDAKTIHRLLEVGTSEDGNSHIFVRNERNPLNFDAVIVDEMSMVDVYVFSALLKALRLGTVLILVGDSDQLPSVGAGNVLRDLILSGRFKTVRLENIFRQALESLIVVNAHRIINGEKTELGVKNSDFFFIDRRTPEKAVSLVTDLYCRRLPEAYGFSPTDDIQVLCPSKKMELGTVNLNNVLQEMLNPPEPKLPEIAFKGFVLRKGDKVMQIKNNYDIAWTDDEGNVGMGVFNGDVGILEDIDVKNRALTVRFLDRVAEYTGDEVMQLELAYAVTVHKSQGSEFDCVILPLLDFPFQLKYRNLLYTAVTRAKKLLVIVGSAETVAAMAANDRKTLRYTALKYLLGEGRRK